MIAATLEVRSRTQLTEADINPKWQATIYPSLSLFAGYKFPVRLTASASLSDALNPKRLR
jgi:hypothetical protein